MKGPALTVGIEEEYQIIDPVTRDLAPGFDALVTSAFAAEADVKAELHQCQVEIGTRPCANIAELRSELVKLRGLVIKAAGEHGLTIASAGTHLLQLDEHGDDAEGAIPRREGRAAGSGAPPAHLRHACACGH